MGKPKADVQKIEIRKGPNFVSGIATDMTFSHTPNIFKTIALNFQYATSDVKSMTLEDTAVAGEKTLAFNKDDVVSFRESLCRIDVPIIILKDACNKILKQIEQIEAEAEKKKKEAN